MCCSSGGGAPPPDPRLTQAQIESLNQGTEASRKQMQMMDDLSPLYKENMQFGLDSSKTSFQQAQDDRKWMMGRRDVLDKLQDQANSDASNYDVGSKTAEYEGKANADLQSGFANARASGLRNIDRTGGNRFGAAAAIADNASSVGLAANSARAGAMARDAAKAEKIQLTDRAHAMLSGGNTYAQGGMQATGLAAGYGAAGQSMVGQGMGAFSSGYGAAGNMSAQVGSNATGMWNAQANYKNNQDQIAASNDPFNTILGAAAGGAGAYGMGKAMKSWG